MITDTDRGEFTTLETTTLENLIAEARSLKDIFYESSRSEPHTGFDGIFSFMSTAMELTEAALENQKNQQQEIESLQKTVAQMKKI
jgi:hypothetical protein